MNKGRYEEYVLCRTIFKESSDSYPYFCMVVNRLPHRRNSPNFVKIAINDGTNGTKGSEDCEDDDKYSEVVGVYARNEYLSTFSCHRSISITTVILNAFRLWAFSEVGTRQGHTSLLRLFPS